MIQLQTSEAGKTRQFAHYANTQCPTTSISTNTPAVLYTVQLEFSKAIEQMPWKWLSIAVTAIKTCADTLSPLIDIFSSLPFQVILSLYLPIDPVLRLGTVAQRYSGERRRVRLAGVSCFVRWRSPSLSHCLSADAELEWPFSFFLINFRP